MSHVSEEIESQPECWRRAATLRPPALPRPGERVAVVGCGTSWFMAMAYAVLREARGEGETDAFAASEFPRGRAYDRVLAITRSGTTTEVLDLKPDTVIVGDETSPISRTAANVIALPWADERSVVQTRFATTALTLLRGEDLSADAARALAMPLPVDVETLEQVTFVGRGWTVGLAHEAALKCREAAVFWAESYPAMDYRHGPISIAGPGRAVWAFGDVPDGLGEQVRATGAAFVHEPGLDPMAHLIVAQRLAVALAAHRGLDPDAPRHLTRSVILR
ncbi:SIS domain-containing protein [Allorhizocola rhizosphaerae]|uniref:SIS domain-containing protein n=1 Tax=Allorhizocola rhizosphaerae TaxID=1872709 RepID=UPI000E3C0A75|nr:sugar isomerase [Allorhizocola rhizosphaerae]